MKTPPSTPPRQPLIGSDPDPITPITSPVRPTMASPISGSRSPAATVVSLASRVRLGNKDACLYALEMSKFSGNTEFNQKMRSLIELIDRNREQLPLSSEDRKRKLKLQNWAADEISKNS